MAQWSKVVGAPSRKQLLGTTRGKVYLFMGVWRQVAASGSEKVPISLRLRWAIKLQDIVSIAISFKKSRLLLKFLDFSSKVC